MSGRSVGFWYAQQDSLKKGGSYLTAVKKMV
jgi:hypothetical protein